MEVRHNLSHLLNRELRHVEASKLTKLSAIIDKAKAWNRLIKELTRPDPICSKEFGTLQNLNLSLETINIIEQQIYSSKSPTGTLLNHWSITGRRRPTVKSLLGFLLLCDLRQASDCVCQTMIGLDSLEHLLALEQEKQHRSQLPSSEYRIANLSESLACLEPKCSRFSFKSIYESTNAFSDKPYGREGGSKIGEGRFSYVHRAQLEVNGAMRVVAVKLLKSCCDRRHLTSEINLIAKVANKNILRLLGIALGEGSSGSPEYVCLIYDYLANGSLLECLSSGLRSRNMSPLSWKERLAIMTRTAEGISYLHQFDDGPIIHRDIKTANIFIDVDLQPKVGDFTLLRQLDVSRGTQHSQNIMGTSVYMPPEAFRGDLSTKLDTFSFGVVMLELLTGRRPFDSDLDEDLLTYVNDKLADIDDQMSSKSGNSQEKLCNARSEFFIGIADTKAGLWSHDNLKLLFQIALRATDVNKRLRPEMVDLAEELGMILRDVR